MGPTEKRRLKNNIIKLPSTLSIAMKIQGGLRPLPSPRCRRSCPWDRCLHKMLLNDKIGLLVFFASFVLAKGGRGFSPAPWLRQILANDKSTTSYIKLQLIWLYSLAKFYVFPSFKNAISFQQNPRCALPSQDFRCCAVKC